MKNLDFCINNLMTVLPVPLSLYGIIRAMELIISTITYFYYLRFSFFANSGIEWNKFAIYGTAFFVFFFCFLRVVMVCHPFSRVPSF